MQTKTIVYDDIHPDKVYVIIKGRFSFLGIKYWKIISKQWRTKEEHRCITKFGEDFMKAALYGTPKINK